MNSLVTMEWADEWFLTSRPQSEEWTAADSATRQQYLNWASSLIRTMFIFPANFDFDNDTVRISTCEQALWLMRRTDAYPELLTMGLSQASAGPLSVTFDKSFVAPLIADLIIPMLGEMGGDYIAGTENVIKCSPVGF
ncbi:hypothetical protein FACS189443_7020 [Planctomycetales bacterium]|nr:hypothetical protein FACS189443_7020 [Planctomycetales bacterium]